MPFGGVPKLRTKSDDLVPRSHLIIRQEVDNDGRTTTSSNVSDRTAVRRSSHRKNRPRRGETPTAPMGRRYVLHHRITAKDRGYTARRDRGLTFTTLPTQPLPSFSRTSTGRNGSPAAPTPCCRFPAATWRSWRSEEVIFATYYSESFIIPGTTSST